jgi:drug/metabolite transporter superfamily protein YnfA
MQFLSEFWAFLRQRKKFWLLPLFVVMMLVGALLVIAQSSAIAPFIYSIF